MQNLNGVDSDSVAISSVAVGLDAVNHGGRPPDSSMCVDIPPSLECPRSSISAEGAHINMKVSISDIAMGDGGITQARVPVGDESLVHGPRVGEATVGADTRQGNLSFRDKLLSNTSKNIAPNSLAELDVLVRNEDVRLGGSNTLPEIQFSNMIHEAIDAKLACSLVVRLLGRSIGYQALLNRIQALWKPRGEFSLIDLDNAYYLVRFAEETGFHNVLTGGPWVIYGSYLTVQPWSRHFSTKNDYPSQIVAWVRLSNLPYRYYTKSLFRHIAAAIGKVVRVDYNTSEGKRGHFARLAIVVDLDKPLLSGIIIDGHRQDIEYEGLLEICFRCGKYGHAKEVCGITPPTGTSVEEVIEPRNPEDLYGPWMQVSQRRRRLGNPRTNVGDVNTGTGKNVVSGSRFATLIDVSDSVVSVEGSDPTSGDRRMAFISSTAEDNMVGVSRSLSSRTRVQGVTNGVGSDGNVVAQHSNISLLIHDPLVETTKSDNESSKVSLGTSVLDSMLNPGPRVGKGRILPSSLRGGISKPVTKKPGGAHISKNMGPKQAKRDDRHSSSPSLAAGLSNLMEDLINAENLERSKVGVLSSDGIGDGDSVSWIQNSTFDQGTISTMQGALDPGFNRSFKLLFRKRKPEIVIVMEPRISGSAADRFIRRTGFDRSYRVEAHDFAGGIRVLWNESITIDVLAVEALRPANEVAWVLGGDLNVIGSSLERQGGAHNRAQACRYFCDFMLDSGLLDMGFTDPRFTWKRGTLSQRLDRFLCNSDWYVSFPLSEVYHLVKLGSDHRPILLDTCPRVAATGDRPFRYIAAWNEHPDFANFLKGVWSDSASMDQNVSLFQQRSRVWNSEVFGHIGRRKKQLLARIKGLELALENSGNSYLLMLEDELKRELDSVLSQEETSFCDPIVCSPSVMVADMVSISGDWDWYRISPLLPSEIRDSIAAVQPPRVGLGADAPEWRWTDTRQFTSSSAYSFLSDMVLGSSDNFWQKVWTLPIPQQIRTFLWITLHNRNLMNAERYRRHLAPSAICDICGYHTEDMDHILRHCVTARGIWSRVIRLELFVAFLQIPFDEWFKCNIVSTSGPMYGERWKSMFAIYCWLLSKDRCSAVLDSDNIPKEDILARGDRLVNECVNVFINNMRSSHSVNTESLQWSRPAPGWIKGNVDASVHTANGLAAIGGVIRDENGDWIVGFTRPVGHCSVLLVELWVLHDMLARAWSFGFRRVIIETDFLEVIRILQRSLNSFSGNGLVASLRYWIDQNWELVVCHSPRTCNLLADRLATWGRLNSQDALTLSSPPSSLLVVVEADKSGTRMDPLELQDWYSNAAAVCFVLREDQGEVELLEMASAGSEPVGIG
ncbi:hypothetical protein GQ457_01G026590 [Hibiscus cannabinus]